MHSEIETELRQQFAAIAVDAWPRLERSVLARQRAATLLASLERPPTSHGRLGAELRIRIRAREVEAA